ncbi:MAG: hypothetical protein AUJ47_09820 [Candidatus Marinimicrobia bacterium CG1_02_48_14]|nr:MAG: hypothetical protein AUJ47_09820 [Candidatus Marinimicrobia bacterium CG1_02_48_14]
MITVTNKPLALAFCILIVIFLLLLGGAITLTVTNTGMNRFTLMNNFNWMWVASAIAFVLSGLVGWTLFGKKSR